MTMLNNDLTILIPTRNRPAKLLELLQILNSIFQKLSSFEDVSIQKVLISNNSDTDSLKINSELYNMLSIEIVKPKILFLSAEENLLYGLRNIKSQFVWILGDDDVPIYSGVQSLLTELISKPKMIIFNSLASFPNVNDFVLRLDVPKYRIELPFRDLVARAGFWSVPAGFSTIVLDVSEMNFDLIEKWHESKIRIYSHVGLWLHNFANENCVLIAKPLVKYNTNPYDTDDPNVASKHWEEFSKKSNKPYRSPWTFDFSRLLKDLFDSKSFSKEELYVTMDQGHLGARFFLIDNMMSFYIDQLIYENTNSEAIKSTEQEHFLFTQFMIQIDPSLNDDFLILDSLNHKEDMVALANMRDKFFLPENQIKRRIMYEISQGAVINSPFGFLWIRPGFSVHVNCKSIIQPTNVLYAEDALQLEELVFKTIDNVIFQDYSNSLSKIEFQVNIIGTIISRIRKLIPKYLRKHILK